MGRPSFRSAWTRFMEVRMSVDQVGKKIGGNVERNIAAGIFQNACPIRISYVLNKSGVAVPGGADYSVVSGADRQFYIYRVNDMIRFLERTFGKPDKSVRSPKPADFDGLQGLLVIKGHGWANAAGHVTLWDGKVCADACHMMNDPDNGPFVPEVGMLWKLQ